MKNIIELIEFSGILQNLDECEKLKSLAKESPSFKTLLLEEINSRILNLKKRIGYIEKDQKQIGQLTSVMKGYHTELPVQKSKLKNLKDLVEFVSEEQIKKIEVHKNTAVGEFEFSNNFDHVDEKDVLDFFYSNLVKTKYIDYERLKEYLVLAFEENKLPEKGFTINNKPTDIVFRSIFYDYYKRIAGKPYGKQKKYIALLGDYFVGFNNKSLKTNFSKNY
tara:strand:- start:31073 stop:31735 length:663 start_codon:yes stop_codon:yes gene_type:complete